MDSKKEIKISPAIGNNLSKILDDNGNEVASSETVVNEKDLQLYYYVLSNTLNNYKTFKENEHIFRNTVACDVCYQLYSVKDEMYELKTDNITLCKSCYDTNQHRDKYSLKNNKMNAETGLRW